MTIQAFKWEGDDYGERPSKLVLHWVSRTPYTDGSHRDMDFKIETAGIGLNIYCRRGNSWGGPLGVSQANMIDLGEMLGRFNWRFSEMARLRRDNDLESLGRVSLT